MPEAKISQWTEPVIDIASIINNNQTFLDLGGALAAFGLIFAVYQLRKPQWDIVLRIRDRWQQHLFWILGGVGLILILARVVLAQFHPISIDFPFNQFVWYEILAYIFFILSPLSLLFYAQRPAGIFTKKYPERFYEVVIQEIARGGDERLNAVINVLLSNLDDIFWAAKERNSEAGKVARSIIEVVLSDESVVKILTTKRLDGIFHLFQVAAKTGINNGHSRIGISSLIKNLFVDHESFLYKQLGNDGLALSANLYTSIFGSPTLVSNFNLFGYSTLTHFPDRGRYPNVKVIIQALSASIEAYLKNSGVPADHINEGLAYLSSIYGSLVSHISIEEERGVDSKYAMKEEWASLSEITNFIGHSYSFIAYRQEVNPEVKEKEKAQTLKADFSSHNTVNEGIAASIYKCVEQASNIKDSNDAYYNVLDVLHGVMHDEEHLLKEGYRKAFEKRIWRQIAKNVKHKIYPVALRGYLIFIGFCLASSRDDNNESWIGLQTERMRRLLYVDLKPLLESEEKMVNGDLMKTRLLPTVMDFKNGNFTYRMGFGRGEEKVIDPPPPGSASAISEEDLVNPYQD